MESRSTEAIIAAMQGAGPADAALLPAAAHLLAQLLAAKTIAPSPAPGVGVPPSSLGPYLAYNFSALRVI